MARKSEQLLERSRERRAGYKLIDSEIVKEGPEPVPQAFKDQVRDMLESRNSLETSTTREHDRSGYVTDVSTATWQFSTQSFSPRSVVSVNGARDDILKDDKPRSIMKRRELETRDQMLHPSADNQIIEQRQYHPITETVQRFEETRRTEEVERRRYEDEQFGRGIAHARYGSLSDSLRRGELKYIPNGEVRESHWVQNGGGRNMHKSYSTRDVFGGGDHSLSSYRRSSQQMSPFIEFPPSLPRRSDRDYRPVSKSRSYADWDDMGRAGFGREVRRYGHDDDMSRLEAEFRDSLLMPLPNGNMHEMDHRTEAIPGGYETFHRDNRVNAGRRVGKDGLPVDYK
ncbi:unnamed protein product [Haemonchus placei]|uniref:Uncharacterized protein n=1 Tax=Haemonchus placei TaxID=6290 RepID=A0A3P8CSR8_HAEPC|nr:unnamed protein product [Haemonchus placei]